MGPVRGVSGSISPSVAAGLTVLRFRIQLDQLLPLVDWGVTLLRADQAE